MTGCRSCSLTTPLTNPRRNFGRRCTSERGIKEREGYGSERWRVEPDYAVRLDLRLREMGMLLEPTSVVAKVWEQVERISATMSQAPKPSPVPTSTGYTG